MTTIINQVEDAISQKSGSGDIRDIHKRGRSLPEYYSRGTPLIYRTMSPLFPASLTFFGRLCTLVSKVTFSFTADKRTWARE